MDRLSFHLLVMDMVVVDGVVASVPVAISPNVLWQRCIHRVIHHLHFHLEVVGLLDAAALVVEAEAKVEDVDVELNLVVYQVLLLALSVRLPVDVDVDVDGLVDGLVDVDAGRGQASPTRTQSYLTSLCTRSRPVQPNLS